MSTPTDAILKALLDPTEPELLDDDEMVAAFDALASALPPATPRPSARSRLLAAVAADPYAPYLGRLSELFRVGVDQVRGYLDSLATTEAWVQMGPGIELAHVAGGPGLETADVGFVRLAEGTEFPRHTHVGAERNLVLKGTVRDDRGNAWSAGEWFEMPAGSTHSFAAEGGELVFAVYVIDGIELEGGGDLPGH